METHKVFRQSNLSPEEQGIKTRSPDFAGPIVTVLASSPTSALKNKGLRRPSSPRRSGPFRCESNLSPEEQGIKTVAVTGMADTLRDSILAASNLSPEEQGIKTRPRPQPAGLGQVPGPTSALKNKGLRPRKMKSSISPKLSTSNLSPEEQGIKTMLQY